MVRRLVLEISRMIGYHYTSYDNWLEIKKKGLIPYEIHKREIRRYFPDKKIMRVWIWTKRFHGVPHAGSVLYQLAYRSNPHVVLLSVDITGLDILRYHWPYGGWGDVNIFHDGHIENWTYHTGEEQSVLVTQRISPGRIHLLKDYDILKLLA